MVRESDAGRRNKMSRTDEVLVKDEKYEGKYVAFPSFDDLTVVAFGEIPEEVVNQAHAVGVKEPVIVFIPKTGVSYIY